MTGTLAKPVAIMLGAGSIALGTWLAMDQREPKQPSRDTARPTIRRQADTVASHRTYPYFRKLDTVLDAIRKETDPDQRETLLANTVASMLEKDPAAALGFLIKSSPPELREHLLPQLLHDWAETAPEAALAAVLELEKEPSARLIGIVYETWAAQDTAAAVASLDRLPSGHLRQQAGMSIASEAIRSDPQQALQLVAGLSPTPERDALLARASSEWAGQEPDEATAWAREIEDEDLRMTITAGIATAMGESSPDAAASVALEILKPGRLLDDTVVAILQRWAQTDPMSAAAWLETFPEGELREDAIDSFVKIWSAKDPEASARWVASIPVSSE